MVDEQKGRLKEETVAAGVSLMQNAILVLQVWNSGSYSPGFISQSGRKPSP